MYRNGVYDTEDRVGEGRDRTRQKRHSHPHVEPLVVPQTHNYDAAQQNFEDLQRQLSETTVEDQKHRHQNQYLPRQPPPNAYQQHFNVYQPPTDHNPRPVDAWSDSEEDYSSEFSSRDSSPPTASTSPHQRKPRASSSKHSHGSTHSPRSPPSSSSPSILKDGYREARHFAGGIIRHPSESNEHYSVLRHTHGLVFYQGTSTAITISIFADTPLPVNRTIWLKPKTTMGTTSCRATAPQQTQGLLNVTPEGEVEADQINPSDERAWQRDIDEFYRRKRRGPHSKHILRETDIVRIPPEAGDGYFQLVLGVGEHEEVLCVSPVFRLISVSPAMGRITGANWATLPFEAGAMLATIQARTAIAAAVMPMKAAAKTRATPYMPAHTGKAQAAGKLAYGAGAADKIGEQITEFNSPYEKKREGLFTTALKIDDDYENGPKHPYPIRFNASCDAYSGKFPERHVLPMTKLVNVPEPITYKLSGYYFGWIHIPSKRSESSSRRRRQWFEAVIVVSPVDIEKIERVTISRANEKDVHIQLLADDQRLLQRLMHEEIKVEVFGSLRPWDAELENLLAEDMQAGEEVAFETARINEIRDIELTRTILDVPAWGPEAVSQQEKEAEPKPKLHGMERVKQEYAAKRLTVQKKIDQVPLHKVGVRMPVDKMRDRAIVTNGYFVRR